MKIDIITLFNDYNVDYTDNHHHVTKGWVNVHCPFCSGSRNYHLGVHLQTGACNCWRCGSHGLFNVLRILLNVNSNELRNILNKYMDMDALYLFSKRKKLKNRLNENIKIKTPYIDLTEKHRKYLQKRNYDVDSLINIWGLKSFDRIGDYKYRIFIPIYFKNKIVSYQGRTTSDTVIPRYKTCSKEDELIHHKYIVYGYDYAVMNDSIIVVEGVTDAWRIGTGAVATFGITYTITQALLLANFKKVYIMYDNEKNAIRQAKNLGKDISLIGNSEVYVLTNYDSDDPGNLSEKEIKKVRKLLEE